MPFSDVEELGYVQKPSNFLLAAAKSAITHWTENSSSRRILKIDTP